MAFTKLGWVWLRGGAIKKSCVLCWQILLGFTLFFLALAMVIQWARYTSVKSKIQRLVTVIIQ